MRNQQKHRRSARWVLLVACSAVACNDLTEPLPSIGGPYDYVTAGGSLPARQGSIIIIDQDRRTARFDGTFTYVADDGTNISGPLTGAFMSTDRIWFRFLTERFLYHEATYVSGNIAIGEIFFEGLTDRSTESTFTISR